MIVLKILLGICIISFIIIVYIIYRAINNGVFYDGSSWICHSCKTHNYGNSRSNCYMCGAAHTQLDKDL
jgi:nitrogen fixation-related uncharacterized protein